MGTNNTFDYEEVFIDDFFSFDHTFDSTFYYHSKDEIFIKQNNSQKIIKINPNSNFNNTDYTITDIFNSKELKHFIETITTDKSTIYNSDHSEIGSIKLHYEEKASRSDVRLYVVTDDKEFEKLYCKKKFTEKKSLQSELDGIKKLEHIIQVPKIYTFDEKNLSISLEYIPNKLFFDYLTELNPDSKKEELNNLVEEIGNIGLEGKRLSIKAYNIMQGNNLISWFNNGFYQISNQQDKELNELNKICLVNLSEIKYEPLFYVKDAHPRNLFFDGKRFQHIDFEHSQYAPFQFELANLLEYEEMKLDNNTKESILKHFVSYINQDRIIIPSHEQFIDQYYKVAFARNIKSAISRASWSKQSQNPIYMDYKTQHLNQALNNDIAIKNSNTNDQIIYLSQHFLN